MNPAPRPPYSPNPHIPDNDIIPSYQIDLTDPPQCCGNGCQHCVLIDDYFEKLEKEKELKRKLEQEKYR
jgi:hypothetical protein